MSEILKTVFRVKRILFYHGRPSYFIYIDNYIVSLFYPWCLKEKHWQKTKLSKSYLAHGNIWQQYNWTMPWPTDNDVKCEESRDWFYDFPKHFRLRENIVLPTFIFSIFHLYRSLSTKVTIHKSVCTIIQSPSL